MKPVELEGQILRRGQNFGHTQSVGGPRRHYYGFVHEAVYPEVANLFRRKGRR